MRKRTSFYFKSAAYLFIGAWSFLCFKKQWIIISYSFATPFFLYKALSYLISVSFVSYPILSFLIWTAIPNYIFFWDVVKTVTCCVPESQECFIYPLTNILLALWPLQSSDQKFSGMSTNEFWISYFSVKSCCVHLCICVNSYDSFPPCKLLCTY